MRGWLAAALAVLALGLGTGALVYVTAEDSARPEYEDSRAYRGQIERFGGKASVLFDRFLRWFDGLWHGKALGVTIVWLSVLVALAMALMARYLTPQDRK